MRLLKRQVTKHAPILALVVGLGGCAELSESSGYSMPQVVSRDREHVVLEERLWYLSEELRARYRESAFPDAAEQACSFFGKMARFISTSCAAMSMGGCNALHHRYACVSE